MSKVTMDTLTVEHYKKLKAGNATDGSIISFLGTYPTKFSAWKRENGLIGYEKEDEAVEVVAEASQEDAQGVEEVKLPNSTINDYKAMYEELKDLNDSLKKSYEDSEVACERAWASENKLIQENRMLSEEVSRLKVEASTNDDILASTKREYNDVIQSQQHNQQGEQEYRQLKSGYHALENELEEYRDSERLNIMLMKRVIALSGEHE